MTYIEFKENEVKYCEEMINFLTVHAIGLNDEMERSISDDIAKYTNWKIAAQKCLSRLQKSL